MTEDPPAAKIPLIFFRTLAGSEPVREWLKELPEVERHAVGMDLLRAQWRWPIGMPLCRPMGGGLLGNPDRPAYEADGSRAAMSLSGTSGRIARFY